MFGAPDISVVARTATAFIRIVKNTLAVSKQLVSMETILAGKAAVRLDRILTRDERTLSLLAPDVPVLAGTLLTAVVRVKKRLTIVVFNLPIFTVRTFLAAFLLYWMRTEDIRAVFRQTLDATITALAMETVV